MATIRPPDLHPSQQRVHDDPARFRVLACGRRWGKTRLGSLLCVETAVKGGRAWWVAPSYPVAKVGWRLVRSLARQIPGVDIKRGELMIVFPGGGSVRVRSADNPDSLRGEGLDLAVLDECAFMQEAAWTESLRPALSDRKGRAVFISTPKGRNWFWRNFQRGLEPGGEWASYQMPTADNPFIDPKEIEAARLTLPELTFEQEYLAQFLENQGAVFRNLAACLIAPATTPEEHKGHKVVVGVDWGKQADFTAISVGCATCHKELALDRFNKIDYHFQRGRLTALVNRWGVFNGYVESNSIGTPNLEELHRSGLRVMGFETTATTKPPLIENLALAFEQAEWQFLPEPVWQGELEAYERTVSPVTGRSAYSAPEGMHDDTVIARALMVRAAAEAGRIGGIHV